MITPQASTIALSAYEQAVAAAEVEAAHEEALKENERREELARHRRAYEAALPILGKWFPGVEWNWNPEGDYGHDTILTDRSEQYPYSFKLRVQHYLLDMNEGPRAGYVTQIEVGDYVANTGEGAYGTYFAGTRVKGPADVGRYIQRKQERASS